MDFFRNIEKDIKRYGKKGDHTLEYIGINFEKGVFCEYKCYRFLKSISSDLKIPNNPFENHSILRQLDFQKNHDENTYRISYKVDLTGNQEKQNDILRQHINHIILLSKYDVNVAHIILDINNYIKTLLQTEAEPICVFGGKIDHMGVIHELKIYYQLKIYKREKTSSVLADTEQYLRIIEFMGTMGKVEKEQVKRIKNVFRIASDSDFEPMMMGVDIGKEVHKIKYYFQINENFFKGNDYYKLRCLSNSLDMERLIQKLTTLGLEIKGFTIPYLSYNTHSMTNLYFCEI